MRGYSLPEILAGDYINHSYYPQPIIDWSQTRKINGKIVSNLRKKVKERLLSEKGEEYYNATATKRTVEKYREAKDRQYREVQDKEAEIKGL